MHEKARKKTHNVIKKNNKTYLIEIEKKSEKKEDKKKTNTKITLGNKTFLTLTVVNDVEFSLPVTQLTRTPRNPASRPRAFSHAAP